MRAELGEAACRLEAEQAAAGDDDRAGRPCRSASSRVSATSASTSSIVRYTRACSRPGGRARARSSRWRARVVPAQDESARGRRGARDAVDGDDALAGDEADVPSSHIEVGCRVRSVAASASRVLSATRSYGRWVSSPTTVTRRVRSSRACRLSASRCAAGPPPTMTTSRTPVAAGWSRSWLPSVARMMRAYGWAVSPCYIDVTAGTRTHVRVPLV